MSRPTLLRLTLPLASLVGVLAAIRLVSIPGEAGSALLFGLSAVRLALLAAVLLPTLGLAVLTFAAWCSRAWMERLERLLFGRGFALALPAALLLLSAGWLFFAWPWILDRLGEAAFVRLAPVAAWAGWLGGLGVTVLLLGRGEWRVLLAPAWQGLWRVAGLALAALLLTWSLIILTGIGLTPDVVGWDPPGAPVVFAQVLIAGGAGALWWAVLRAGGGGKRPGVWPDVAAVVALWIAAAVVWSAAPILPTHFTPLPRQPNMEIYPYSDAAGYDISAQHLLVGSSEDAGVPRKPLFALFLAGLHRIAGQDYERVVGVQVWLLAVIPPLLYLLGRALGSRPAGLAAGALALMRESNALWLARDIRLSHSKLLMSDMPALAAMLLLTLLMIAWLRRPEERRAWPLAVGGMLGLFTLLRGQVLVLLPFVLLAALPVLFRRWRLLLEATALIAFGLALTLAPWLGRNARVTGSPALEDPTQYIFLAEQFSLNPTHDTMDEAVVPHTPDYYRGKAAQVRAFILEHPGAVAGFVSAHFAHNLVESVIYLPASLTLETPAAAIARLPFWGEWDGRLPSGTWAMVLLHLTLIALGLGLAWRRNRAPGLVPLILALGYSLSVTAARYSGWRLILPSDWIAYFYLVFGLEACVLALAAAFDARLAPPQPEVAQTAAPVRAPWGAWLGLAALFLLLGALFPLVEWLTPARYQARTPQQVLARYRHVATGAEVPDWASPDALEDFLNQDGALALQGRAMYPRYYLSGEGEAGHGWPSTRARDERRLGFYLVGPVSAHVVLVTDNVPRPFPNAADVLVFGCNRGDHLEALFILIEGQPPVFHYPIPFTGLTCSSSSMP